MKIERPPFAILAMLGGAIILILSALLLYFFRDQLPPRPALSEVRNLFASILTSIPRPVYFLAFVILPAFGVPLTVFYLTAIPVLGSGNEPLGVVLAITAVICHMVFCRWLALGILQPFIERLIRHRNLTIPRMRPDNETRIVLAMRLSPLPLALQNYLLALGQARWRTYLWLSIPVQGGIGVAIMFLGESALDGQLGLVILALFLFVLLNLLLSHLRKRYTS